MQLSIDHDLLPRGYSGRVILYLVSEWAMMLYLQKYHSCIPCYAFHILNKLIIHGIPPKNQSFILTECLD